MSSSNNGADIYMILLRPTRVPVLGEAVSHLFQGQILLDSLSWKLSNEEEALKAARDAKESKPGKAGASASAASSASAPASAVKNLSQELARHQAALQRDLGKASTEAERNALQDKHAKWISTSLDAMQKKLQQSPADASKPPAKDKAADATTEETDVRKANFEFTFSKSMDIASTQMLNSMKAGDIFPSGTLTIHKRSTTAVEGTSLVFTIQKIRLTDYKLTAVPGETMTEMVEEWTCEFGALAYVYKNPPAHYAHGNAGQAAAKTVSQATMRAFTMKNIGSPV